MAAAMETVEVIDYVSDVQINANENKEKVKKRQGRRVEEMVFNNFTEAEETVTKQGH
jgi:hypothetical protein